MSNRVVKSNALARRKVATIAKNQFSDEQILKSIGSRAIKEAHQAGIATTHGDEKGLYLLHPNGKKEHMSPVGV